MHPVVRALVWSVALAGVFLLGLFMVRDRGSAAGFMSVRVVNDTTRTVKVQPCWDAACFDILGVKERTLRPGASWRIPRFEWVNNFPELIVLGVLKPYAEPMHFNGCLLAFFPPRTDEAVFHVSLKGQCPSSNPGGGG